MISLGKELRKARIDKSLSQQELAAQTGLSQKHISALESDQMMPKWPTIVALALALDLHLDTLAKEWSGLQQDEQTVAVKRPRAPSSKKRGAAKEPTHA